MDIKLVEWKSDIVYIVQRVYVYDMLIDLGLWMYVCVYVCLLRHVYIYCYGCRNEQERPYHDDSTASRLLSEVKHRRAWLVLRWGTTLESQVLFFLPPSRNSCSAPAPDRDNTAQYRSSTPVPMPISPSGPPTRTAS